MSDTEERYEQTFEVGLPCELSLENVRGRIEVITWAEPRVHVVAIKRLGTYLGAQRAFEETMVVMRQTGNRVRLYTDSSGGAGLFGWFGIGVTPPLVDYTVQVPKSTQVSIKGVGCSTLVQGIEGAAYVKSVSSDITLRDCKGSLILNNVSGEVTGDQLSGSLGVKTISGGVTVRRSRLSSAWAKTVSGNIFLETTLQPGSNYTGSSVSGGMTLAVPAQTNATIRLHTTSGRAECQLPCQVIESSRTSWRGKIGDGSAQVEFRSVSGGLVVKISESPADTTTTPPPPPPPPTPAGDSPELAILRAVERGEMTVEEALTRLSEFDRS